eukprot:s1803_g16.t1
MRLKGSLTGDGAHVKLSSLYYLSVHTLDGADGYRYAKNRVSRDLLDLWLEKKISYGGAAFDDSCDVLTEEDTWRTCHHCWLPGKSLHEKHHQASLKNLLESGPAASVEAAREEPVVGGNGEQGEEPEFRSFESIEKMQESEAILSRCASEISGVEILKGKNGGIYLVSEKKRILPKHTLIGGYGAGKYIPFDANLPAEEQGKQVKLDWKDGDRTVIQVDMQSLQPESTAVEAMSVYKYLLLLEKHKRVTSYEVSYTTCARKSGAGSDGFDINPKELHCYKTMNDLSKALTCKTIFWDSAEKIESSKGLLTVFRFRFDRIHAVTKVQKPYVFTRVAVGLEAGQPVLVA